VTDALTHITLTVNGVTHELDIEPRELLVTVLRERLRLTGTHIGCETTSCGACTVLFDGQSVKSCTVLAVQAADRAITTIEGLAGDGQLHPVQEAFRRCHGLQCGFCTPGRVMAAVSLIDEGRATSEASVRSALTGNLCRCTGYHNIVQSVLEAARVMS
jgi:aerobic-type carbon monoxide dehydrogenase small subunit (CoxS/CutS family)